MLTSQLCATSSGSAPVPSRIRRLKHHSNATESSAVYGCRSECKHAVALRFCSTAHLQPAVCTGDQAAKATAFLSLADAQENSGMKASR